MSYPKSHKLIKAMIWLLTFTILAVDISDVFVDPGFKVFSVKCQPPINHLQKEHPQQTFASSS
jgi:hypothetical protein